MPSINELFFENGEAYMYLTDIEEMNDLDDFMCGFHRISMSMTNDTLDGEKVLKVCFGDLVDESKLKAALTEYFQ